MTQDKLGVYKAINGVMKQIAVDGIAKDRSNQQQGYKFRGIDDIYNALCVMLHDNGLTILPVFSERVTIEKATKAGGILFYTVVRGDFTFKAVSDGSEHVVTVYGEAMDSGDKATNKAMSAAYKYACLQTFCIPTEGDNDADATTHEITATNPSQPAQPPVAPTPRQAASPAASASRPPAQSPAKAAGERLSYGESSHLLDQLKSVSAGLDDFMRRFVTEHEAKRERFDDWGFTPGQVAMVKKNIANAHVPSASIDDEIPFGND